MPAAENVTPLTANFISADGQMIPALFPPNSRRFRPRRFATMGANALPISQLPVAENKATFSFLARFTAASLPPYSIRTKSE